MQGKVRDIQRFLLWTALYLVGAVIAARFLRGSDGVSLLWPSAGIGYAVAVRYGLRWTGVVAVASLLLALFSEQSTPLYVALIVAGKTAATAIAAGYVLRGQAMHLRTSDGMRLLGGGVLLGILSAAFGVFALQHTGRLETAHVADAFARWALGDVLGIAVVTPTLLLMTTSRNREHALSPFHEASSIRERLFWIALLATCFLAIHSLGDRGIYVLGLISLPLVLLLWSALRFSAVWTSVATGVTVLYFSVSTVLGLGGFTAPGTLLEATVLLLLLSLV